MPKATVRVMRSYDYNHFECTLSDDRDLSLEDINKLREQCAHLVDAAVIDFRVSKAINSFRALSHDKVMEKINVIANIKLKPKGEWSAAEAALIKAAEDDAFWKEMNANLDYYNYGDDEREYHFRMLSRFRDVVVKA